MWVVLLVEHPIMCLLMLLQYPSCCWNKKKNNSIIAIESPEFSKHVFSRSAAETSLFQNSVKLWIRLSQLKTHQLTILNFNSGKFFILLRPRYEHKYSTMNKDRTLYVVNSHVSANKSLCVHRRQELAAGLLVRYVRTWPICYDLGNSSPVTWISSSPAPYCITSPSKNLQHNFVKRPRVAVKIFGICMTILRINWTRKPNYFSCRKSIRYA